MCSSSFPVAHDEWYVSKVSSVWTGEYCRVCLGGGSSEVSLYVGSRFRSSTYWDTRRLVFASEAWRTLCLLSHRSTMVPRLGFRLILPTYCWPALQPTGAPRGRRNAQPRSRQPYNGGAGRGGASSTSGATARAPGVRSRFDSTRVSDVDTG